MEPSFPLAALATGLALAFSFSNGFHDSANQVATVISARVLSPEVALTLAALSGLIGACLLGTRVAEMIGKGLLDPSLLQSSSSGLLVLTCALCGALAWNLITWRFGLPSSSSHALIGGLLGAFVAGWGAGPVHWNNVLKIVAVMLLSPLAGFFFTYLATKLVFAVGESLTPKAAGAFKALQVSTLIVQSLAHGSNDAQKIMGVIVFVLILTGMHPPGGEWTVPFWVAFVSALAMAAGTLAGGWRIIRVLGSKFYRVRPIHAFSSQASSGVIMLAASIFGYPISTTQVISSSVVGAGAGFRPKNVRWEAAGDMVVAWMVTIPASALIAAGLLKVGRFFFPASGAA